ncbi:MAG: glycosyltransferase [Patescibacteria group bacterium]
MKKIFIHTNNKQLLGAVLAKYAIEKYLPKNSKIIVEYINVDKIEAFKNFAGKEYLFAGKSRIYDPRDLQSFTLSRFMAPELMNYKGMAVIIDPDIFAVKDISKIFDINMSGKSIAVCRKKSHWDTSFMLMDCAKLTHWRIDDILKGLGNKKLDYVADIMSLKHEPEDSITELPRIWNNLDILTDDTLAIHMTNRLTQPWKTGLPIDFTRNPMPKIFGLIPREPIHKLLGKYPSSYQKHPNQKIENLFFNIAKEALKGGIITENLIRKEIDAGYIRKDFLENIPV